MPSLSFAKLVATPTDPSWSQAYNAGNLFVCLSVSKKEDSSESLHEIGKDILDNLEAEFFTLEEKNLDNIKQAIATSIKERSPEISINLTLAYFKDNLLYIFIAGSGKAIMKRGMRIGTLLEKEDDNHKKIDSASGFLEDGDIIVLQTHQFSKNVPHERIKEALSIDLPSDIAEILSPHMHEQEDGGQAAIIVAYKGGSKKEELLASLESENQDTESELSVGESLENEDIASLPHKTQELEKENSAGSDEPVEINTEKPITAVDPLISSAKRESFLSRFIPQFLKKQEGESHINHRKKVILSILIILTVLLTVSIFMSKNREEQQKIEATFNEIYEPALKNYEDGVELKSINESFARESFIKARELITNGLSKFKDGSDEKEKLNDLLKKIESELGIGDASIKIKAESITVDDNSYLSVVKNETGLAHAENDTTIYVLTKNSIVSIDKSDGDKETVIENDEDWKDAVGLSVYQGNIYILDTAEGIIKYVAGADGFGKNTYFSGTGPNLGKATDMAIDGSIYILLTDNLLKYTSGTSDNLKLSGLVTPLKDATKIATDINMDSVYVLDRGNSRIVKFSKDGAYENQYVADVLKDAEEFVIVDNESKAHILSGDKYWEIKL